MEIVAFVLLGIIIALGAFLLYREFINQISALTTRIEKLEEANRKRMPFKSQDEILDAIAALDLLEYEEDIKANLRKNAKAHLFNALEVGTKREQQ